MCGIVGYIGDRKINEILLNGLHRLEYRGYDSAGISILKKDHFEVTKTEGKVSILSNLVHTSQKTDKSQKEHSGIAHTRWATHGEPTILNAHPHLDDKKQFALVHNGIIENYASLKTHLESKGHKFLSQTDSEVLAHLISEYYSDNFIQAVVAALKKVEGTYGIIVQSINDPETLVVARCGSPVIIGVGKDETYIASDLSAIIAHTQQIIFLDDDDIALVTSEGVDIINIDNVSVSREISKVDWTTEVAEKCGYEHFMLKETFEQPTSIKNSILGRIDLKQGSSILSGLNSQPRDLVEIDRIVLAACGTSMHAGMVGEYFFEDLADIPAEVEQAAEFRYRNPIINSKTMVIALSQSGETADTLAAVREAKQKGALVCGICNVVGSTIARECGRGIYLHAGPEIGVASTKAFTSQVAVLLMMGLKLGRCHRLSRQAGIDLAKEIVQIPVIVQKVLDTAPVIEKIAKKYASKRDFFFIGRGYLFPAALEGALKLKEISYIHAEGYHAAELKHGPIALLDENVPVVALANNINGRDKIIGNVSECIARKAPVILTATEGDTELKEYSEDIMWIPETSRYIASIPTVVALQLLSYYIARERGCSIDQPRNLAKSVTVE